MWNEFWDENRDWEPERWGWVRPVIKVIIALLVIALFGFTIVKCHQDIKRESMAHQNQATALLSGEHLLQKLGEVKDVNSQWTVGGVFFAFTGGIYGGGSSSSEMKIIFSWQMNNGKYALSEMPFAKVFVNLDEKIQTPSVQFEWKDPDRYYNWYEVNSALRCIVVAVTINCHPDQWPKEIRMPMNSTER